MNPGTKSQQRPTESIFVQSWEVETVQQQFPQFSEQQIKHALEGCKRELGDGTAHEKMMRCVESKLK
ncbi:MAG: hypothetical protein JWM68_3271 [Verrucomicrobiales bacterium]|nr:hypothetical protein [Verrucomicrobiales bacterium]